MPYRHLHPTNMADPVKPSFQRLDEYLPTGGTLFHELLHLLMGVPLTRIPIRNAPPGSGYEEYDLSKMLNMPADMAMFNPQSYTLAAHAYSLTQFHRSFSGKIYEWTSGEWQETLGD